MRLTVALAGAELTLTFAGETMAKKATLPFDAALVQSETRAIIGVLARGNRARTLSDKNLDDLKHHGEVLWRTLVPPEMQRELQRGDSLTLALDESLVAVPWELMFDGAQFLCRRLAIGRVVATRQARRGDERRTVGTPIRVLVLACDPGGDLAEVRAEGDAIVGELERHATVRARLNEAPDRAFMLRHIKDYDVLHFAGHADWNAGAPGQSGWLLADGKLTADEIAKLGGGRPMPMVVFGNACQSGHTEPWATRGDVDQVFGLANAFLTAGVRHYIGTQWEVVDGQSAKFAAELYRHLSDGTAIGAAMRHARAAVVGGAGEQALAWASYVLYGDPEVRPLHRAEQNVKLSIPSGLKIAARASAPWKRPAATGRQAMPSTDDKNISTGDKNVISGDKSISKRRVPAWLPAALLGLVVGVTGVTLTALWLHWRRPPMQPHPTSRGLAVLALSASSLPDDQRRARDLEGCLPSELTARHVELVPPENVMTLQAETNGAMDRMSARQLGLAVGAKFVLFGHVAENNASIFVAKVVDDVTVYGDSFPVDNVPKRCKQVAAAAAKALDGETL
jgi:CHAT domain-containing protein